MQYKTDCTTEAIIETKNPIIISGSKSNTMVAL